MDITITIPDQLTEPMEAFRQTQISKDGQTYKYADLEDMCQQALNGGLFATFAGPIVAAAVATEQAALDAAKEAAAIQFPIKASTPVIVAQPPIREKLS